MVGYARHNIHFRKPCAHFKIFNSVEILYCKLSTARVRVRACAFILKIQTIVSWINGQNHHGNANDNLLRVGYHRKQL